jgi:hypothetical protein
VRAGVDNGGGGAENHQRCGHNQGDGRLFHGLNVAEGWPPDASEAA